jgi:hypothetical protein
MALSSLLITSGCAGGAENTEKSLELSRVRLLNDLAVVHGGPPKLGDA